MTDLKLSALFFHTSHGLLTNTAHKLCEQDIRMFVMQIDLWRMSYDNANHDFFDRMTSVQRLSKEHNV